MFIQTAKARGHKPIIVTARHESIDNIDTINAHLDHWQCQMPIFFANLAAKEETMRNKGIKVDIWIDDSPHALVFGH